MVSAFCGGCSLSFKSGSTTFVRAQPPARRRRFIDCSSNKGMPEPKPAGNVGLANQVKPQ